MLKLGSGLLALFLTVSLHAATFAVTSGADSGLGTLRQALLDANATPGRDVILIQTDVNITSASLPPITDAVEINGAKTSGTALITGQLDKGGFVFAGGSGGSVLTNVFIRTFRDGIIIAPGVSDISIGPLVSSRNNAVSDLASAGSNVRIGVMLASESGGFSGGLVEITGADTSIGGSNIDSLRLSGATNTQIGVPRGNIIRGLVIENSPGTLVTGNTIESSPTQRYVGITVADNTSLPVIDRNILYNLDIGIHLHGRATITRNRFETNPFGVFADAGSEGTVIGGEAAGVGNTFLKNDIPIGVVHAVAGVSIFGNSIYRNDFAIDLGNDGPTANDPAPDADTGANRRQNYPVLTAARTQAGTLVVDGTLTSAPNTTYLVQLFSNDSAEPEARTLLASFEVATDATGNAAFSQSVAGTALLPGEVITATATSRATGDTSEIGPPQDFDAATIPTASTWALLALGIALSAITLIRIGR